MAPFNANDLPLKSMGMTAASEIGKGAQNDRKAHPPKMRQLMLKAFCDREQILLAVVDNYTQKELSSKLFREQVWKRGGATESCPAASSGLTAQGSHGQLPPLRSHNPTDPTQTDGGRRNGDRQDTPPRPSPRRALAEERGTAGAGAGRGEAGRAAGSPRQPLPGAAGRGEARLPW